MRIRDNCKKQQLIYLSERRLSTSKIIIGVIAIPHFIVHIQGSLQLINIDM